MPVKMSPVCVFADFGVEYCIGFALDGNQYRFWISRADRDPCMIMVDREKIGWIDV
jgi:hypothetical protein